MIIKELIKKISLKNDLIKLLLIEDDEDDYLITQDILWEISEQKYQVTWIANYDQAVEAIKTFDTYDVILVDFYLGKSTGLELLQVAQAQGVKTAIIMLTGLGDREIDSQAIQAGAADYLVKQTINADILERSIRYSIERKRIEAVLRSSELRFRKLAQKEQLLNHLYQQIRDSLDLDRILNQAVSEISNLLEIDRCLFVWYHLENNQPQYEIVAQSYQLELEDSLDPDSLRQLELLHPNLWDLNKIGKKIPWQLIYKINQKILERLNFPVILTIPVKNSTYLGKKGFLLCEKWCSARDVAYGWEESQIELLQAVASQLAIAISQAELYEQAKIAQSQSEKLLLNILPPQIATRLKEQKEGIIAETFAEVSVLFADIVNFTQIASRMQAQAMVKQLNLIFSTFDHLTEKYEVEKIKTIGDAYMVVAGVPVPRGDHLEAIVEMALEMQEAIKNFAQDDGKPFSLRIGINAGAAVAGVIGMKKFIYDLWGDTVNIASRMESQGEAGKIQVTQIIYEKLKNKYLFEERGEIEVKGKGMMLTYWLMGRN